MSEKKHDGGTKQTFRCPNEIKADILTHARNNRYSSTSEVVVSALKNYFTFINNNETYADLHYLAQNYKKKLANSNDETKITFRIAQYMKDNLENLSASENVTVTDIILDAIILQIYSPKNTENASMLLNNEIQVTKNQMVLKEIEKKYTALLFQLKTVEALADNIKKQIEELKKTFPQNENNVRIKK